MFCQSPDRDDRKSVGVLIQVIGEDGQLAQDRFANLELQVGKLDEMMSDISQEQNVGNSEVSLSNIPSSVWEQVQSKLSYKLVRDLPASTPKVVPAFLWKGDRPEREQSDRLTIRFTCFAVEPKLMHGIQL